MDFPFDEEELDFGTIPQNPSDEDWESNLDIQNFDSEPTTTKKAKKYSVPQIDFSFLRGIHWNVVISLFFAVIMVALVVIFRKEITDFLEMLLSWAITLLIIYLILLWITRKIRRK